MNPYYVYQLRAADSSLPFYIGKGKGGRLHIHLLPSSLSYVNRKNGVIKSLIKTGIEVMAEKLCINMSEEEAIKLEIILIAKLGRLDIGTGILANMTDGGDGVSGKIITDEARKNMSIAGKKRPTRPPPTDSVREQISSTLKGKPISEAARRKRVGKKHAKSHSENISAALKAANLAQTRVRKPCPHCKQEFTAGTLARWHGDKCKLKKEVE